jgi:hypothetical protein
MATYIIIGGDGKEYGPISADDLRQWISEGRLNAQSLAKAVSDAEFRPLEKFPEFADAWGRGGTPGTIAPPTLSADDWLAQVIARPAELRLGECLGAGWSFLGANFGFLAGAVFLTWLTNLVFVFGGLYVPVIGPLATIGFNAVIMGGFYLACLRRWRGEAVAPTEVFSGFTGSFGQLLLAGLVGGLLTEFSFCCFILPAIYLAIAWSFAVPLVADRKLFFWSAMEVSRKIVTKVWFEVFALFLLAFLPMVIFEAYNVYVAGNYFLGLYDQAGHNLQQMTQLIQSQNDQVRAMTLRVTAIGQVIFLVNLFYFAGVIIRAYENLFGEKKS